MGEGVPLTIHFERIIREERQHTDSILNSTERALQIALDHHRERHESEHTWAERINSLHQERIQAAIKSFDIHRDDVARQLTQLLPKGEFEAFTAQYRERHNELRERSDGRDDRLRDEFNREMEDIKRQYARDMEHYREEFARELATVKKGQDANSRALSEMRGRYTAWAAAITVFLTVIAVGIQLVGRLSTIPTP